MSRPSCIRSTRTLWELYLVPFFVVAIFGRCSKLWKNSKWIHLFAESNTIDYYYVIACSLGILFRVATQDFKQSRSNGTYMFGNILWRCRLKLWMSRGGHSYSTVWRKHPHEKFTSVQHIGLPVVSSQTYNSGGCPEKRLLMPFVVRGAVDSAIIFFTYRTGFLPHLVRWRG